MTTLHTAVADAIDHLIQQDADVPPDVWQGAILAGVFKAKAGDLAGINAGYHNVITASLVTYFEGGSVTGPKNRFKRAMVEAFGAAFDMGYVDGGGAMPPDPDALEWLNARVTEELAHIDTLFVQAKELRKDKEMDYFAWITSRADGYTQSVTSVYNAGKMYANVNQLLTWRYGEAEHCETCEKLNGQRHRASWYLARNFIPGKPGASMECGGYRCRCSLLNNKGQTVFI